MINRLQQALTGIDDLDFAVLIGSRATGQPRDESDWDIAVQWHDYRLPPLDIFRRDEVLRQMFAEALGVTTSLVDIVDLHRTGLAIRSVVAEEGIPLAGEDSLPWMRFLTRTWHELEYWHWEQGHAA
jgi:predicted nucleotidyltransferase